MTLFQKGEIKERKKYGIVSYVSCLLIKSVNLKKGVGGSVLAYWILIFGL